MNDVVFKTLKQKDFILKSFVLKVASELDLSLADTILLVYFSNQEVPVLDIKNIKETTYLSEQKILESYDKLVSLKLIDVNVGKDENGKISEVISLDRLIQNVTQDITAGIKKKSTIDLLELLESEFGRTISPMETEMVKRLIKEYDIDMIKEALSEAVYNNSKSLKYIEMVLVNWKEEGYKSVDDIKKGLVEYSNKKTITNDLYDYNWLDDES